MQLDRIQRAVLSNQHKILAALYPDELDYHEQAIEILSSGYEFEYDNIVQHIYESTLSESRCREVIHTLSMYQMLNYFREDHGIPEGMSEYDFSFSGYDGNNETAELGYARFLVNQPGRWDMFKNEDLNSHMPSTQIYARMREAWNQSEDVNRLTEEDVRRIFDARTHLSNR